MRGNLGRMFRRNRSPLYRQGYRDFALDDKSEEYGLLAILLSRQMTTLSEYEQGYKDHFDELPLGKAFKVFHVLNRIPGLRRSEMR